MSPIEIDATKEGHKFQTGPQMELKLLIAYFSCRHGTGVFKMLIGFFSGVTDERAAMLSIS